MCNFCCSRSIMNMSYASMITTQEYFTLQHICWTVRYCKSSLYSLTNILVPLEYGLHIRMYWKASYHVWNKSKFELFFFRSITILELEETVVWQVWNDSGPWSNSLLNAWKRWVSTNRSAYFNDVMFEFEYGEELNLQMPALLKQRFLFAAIDRSGC